LRFREVPLVRTHHRWIAAVLLAASVNAPAGIGGRPANAAPAASSAVSGPAGRFKDGPHLAFPRGGDTHTTDTAAGWQVTYEQNDYLSWDFTVTRQTDEMTAADIDAPQFPEGGRIDMEIYSFVLTGRLGVRPVERLTLYVGAGTGYYFFNTDAEEVRKGLAENQPAGPSGGVVLTANSEIEKDFGFHVAAGVEWLLTDRWEVFAELRSVTFESDEKIEIVEGVGDARLTHDYNENFAYDYRLWRLGLNYRF
jgi:opacity protein-like surface antigen